MHDFLVQSYSIEFEKKEFLLHAYHNQSGQAAILQASGVLTFSFKYSIVGSILLSVDEIPIDLFIARNETELLDGKAYGWPLPYNDLTDLAHQLKERRLKCLDICASWGLCGWILAEDFQNL